MSNLPYTCPGWVDLLFSGPLKATPCHQKSPSRLSITYLLTIYNQFQAATLLSRGWVGGGEWVVIIILKANLGSTSHLTSQLDLSLAIMMIIVATNIVASQLPERQQTGT